MKQRLLLLAIAFLFTSTMAFAQKTFTGKIVDAKTKETIIGAHIMKTGTSTGTQSNLDGEFSITLSGKGTLTISFIGYAPKEVAFDEAKGSNLGTIALNQDVQMLGELVIVGQSLLDIAKERKTPVAVSTIRGIEISEKLGSKEFPEILNRTPSVYATKQGGGYGDSRVNIRGFDQANTAVMINGMPINDMESGWVYWSNWAGLADVTSAMQVQRGLGASKLAISSVGGTINIVTNAADQPQGGAVSASLGNDTYFKSQVSYNTGKMNNGVSASALLSRISGNGYADGTKFIGYNFFVAVGYEINERHNLQFMVTGAPQWHHQRRNLPSIETYQKYGKDGNPNRRYNADYGYFDGKEFSLNRNFYHKPVATLNYDWTISSKSKLSTLLYASIGRGGGTGDIGAINDKSAVRLPRDERGLIRVDDIASWNSGGHIADFGADRTRQSDGEFYNTGNSGFKGQPTANGVSRRASMNSHNWFGLITNFSTKLTEQLTLDAGFDLRTYKGLHYQRIHNLFGAAGYIDFSDKNFPDGRMITDQYKDDIASMINVFKNPGNEKKIGFYNDANVNWLGAFGQLEYANEFISTFLQGAISRQGFQRVDYFNYLDSDPEQKSAWRTIWGGNLKGGLNWNINQYNNVFANVGYYSKQPLMRAIFPNYYNNDFNEHLRNEKIFGLELGYGLRYEGLSLNVNLYRTSWNDRYLRASSNFDLNGTPKDPADDIRGTAQLNGVKQVHSGIELDARYRIDPVTLYGMVSIGNYVYAQDVTANYVDEDGRPIVLPGETEAAKKTLYLKGKKVGDVPHSTFRLGADWEIINNLKLDASYRYVANLYARIDAPAFEKESQQTLRLPNHGIMDAGLSYKLNLPREQSLSFRLNLDNVLNTLYISESATNIFKGDKGATNNEFMGINTGNQVAFGFGFTWNVSVRYNF